MNEWESNWSGYLALETGSTNAEFTERMFTLWQQSTPLEPWTNNPLGMPQTTQGAYRVLSTDYGAFMSMHDFRDAFLRFLASQPGRTLRDALLLQDKPAPVWRAVSSLHWPASATETDYPSAILDATTDDYRAKVNAARADQRKTSGTVGGSLLSRLSPGMSAQQRVDVMGDIGPITQAIQQSTEG